MSLLSWVQSLFTASTPRDPHMSDEAKAFFKAFEGDHRGDHQMPEMPTMPPPIEAQIEEPLPRFKPRRNPIPISDTTRAGLDALEKRLRDEANNQ